MENPPKTNLTLFFSQLKAETQTVTNITENMTDLFLECCNEQYQTASYFKVFHT